MPPEGSNVILGAVHTLPHEEEVRTKAEIMQTAKIKSDFKDFIFEMILLFSYAKVNFYICKPKSKIMP